MHFFRRNSRYVVVALALIMVIACIYVPVTEAAVGHSVSHGSSSHSSPSSHSSSSGSGSSFSGGGFAGGYLVGSLFSHPIILIIMLIIIYVIYRKMKSAGVEFAPNENNQESYSNYGPVDLSALKAHDEDFSEDLFVSRVNTMFIQLQEAWQEKDWKKVRPFESDELFNLHNKQLQDLINSNTTNMVEEIAILNTKIRDYHEDSRIENLDVYLKVRLKDYIIDDNTRQVIEGDKNLEITMEYLLVMSRKMGVKTQLHEKTTVTTCPNCGANISINASGVCEYCDSVVSNGEFDWVLTRMEVLSQS